MYRVVKLYESGAVLWFQPCASLKEAKYALFNLSDFWSATAIYHNEECVYAVGVDNVP